MWRDKNLLFLNILDFFLNSLLQGEFMNKLDKIHKELDFYTQTVLALELTSLRVARAQLKIDTVKYSIAGAAIGLFGGVGEFLLASRMEDWNCILSPAEFGVVVGMPAFVCISAVPMGCYLFHKRKFLKNYEKNKDIKIPIGDELKM